VSASKLSFLWLLRLRWAAALSLALGIVLVGPALHLALPERALLSIVLVGAVANAFAQVWMRRRVEVPRAAFAAALGFDAVLLTLLLYFSGGSHNPFAASFLLLVVLAATLLGRRAAFVATAIAGVAIFALTLSFVPLTTDHSHAGTEAPHHESEPPRHDGEASDHGGDAAHHDDHDSSDHVLAHAQTVWIGFPILAALTVYLVSSALRQRDLQLTALDARRQRAEQLAELGVIAANAAHELGSPLSTIAVVAKDLERAIEEGQDVSAEDARLIRKQVQRCREALEELARHAEQGISEAGDHTSVGAILDDASQRLADPTRLKVEVGDDVRALEVRAPRRAIGYVLGGILDNACQASPGGAEVTLAARRSGAQCLIEVEDSGSGMTVEDLARAGHRPFARRGSTGSGMGVGLFLSRAVVENLGGELTVEARQPRGTRVALAIPLAGAHTGARA
jgi:two-component system, sensor histidine kinase RegB